MSDEPPLSLRDPWVVRSVAAVVAIFVGATILGFVVFPLIEPNARASGLWDAICSAAGVVRTPTSESPIEPDFTVSPAVMTSDMLRGADADSIGRGATLAQQCAICHGPTGVSRADSPNLAGQYPAVVYKELKDFQVGARVNAIMSPFAWRLSDQDMIDLAAYYAYLPRLPAYHPVGIFRRRASSSTALPCATSRPAARATAPWTTRLEVPGSRVSRSSISNPSLTPSLRVKGETISASRCVMSRAA